MHSKKFDLHIKKFLDLRPEFYNILEFEGTIGDYLCSLGEKIKPLRNSNSLIKVILEETDRVYPNKFQINEIDTQLRNNPLVSTADHHGLLNFNILYHSNLLFGELLKKMDLKYHIVLSSGLIPLDNASFPRGFFFDRQKYSFFSQRYSSIPVGLVEKRIVFSEENNLSQLITNVRNLNISQRKKKFLNELFFERLINKNDFNQYNKFMDQVSSLNFKIWPYYFHSSNRKQQPKMIYLCLDRIIDQLMMKELKEKKSFLYQVLFNPELRESLLRRFNGVQCCWGSEAGTHFFWHVSDKLKLKRLEYDPAQNCLRNDNFKLHFNPENVMEAIKNREIYRCTFLDLLLICFQYQLTCLGGFNQVSYLTQMKNRLNIFFHDYGLHKDFKEIDPVQTDGLICGYTFFKYQSGIDLIYNFYKKEKNFKSGLTQLNLEEILKLNFPETLLGSVKLMIDHII